MGQQVQGAAHSALGKPEPQTLQKLLTNALGTKHDPWQAGSAREGTPGLSRAWQAGREGTPGLGTQPELPQPAGIHSPEL